MRNLTRVLALLVLLGSRATIAQTIGRAGSSTGSVAASIPSSPTKTSRLMGDAPVGHRQPHTRDIPSENAGDLERLSAEDAAVDRKLNICRGC
jgi:hypothetical protein